MRSTEKTYNLTEGSSSFFVKDYNFTEEETAAFGGSVQTNRTWFTWPSTLGSMNPLCLRSWYVLRDVNGEIEATATRTWASLICDLPVIRSISWVQDIVFSLFGFFPEGCENRGPRDYIHCVVWDSAGGLLSACGAEMCFAISRYYRERKKESNWNPKVSVTVQGPIDDGDPRVGKIYSAMALDLSLRNEQYFDELVEYYAKNPPEWEWESLYSAPPR